MSIELREVRLDDGEDFHRMLREIGPGENGFANSGYDIALSDFPKYLEAQVNMSQGCGIDLNTFVHQTRYWLMVGSKPVGVGKLRHYLNDNLRVVGGHIGYLIRPSERGKGYGSLILKELLKKAYELGIDDVLLTCDEDNVRSRKVIERNGGELENIQNGKCRYWIGNLACHILEKEG